MPDISSILGRIKRPTKSVVICLDADLFGDFEALDAQLRTAAPGASLAGNPDADDLMERMESLRAQMVESEVTFRFQALPALDFGNLRARMPTKKDDQSDEDFAAIYHAWVCEVTAASCVDPVMTMDQVDELAAALAAPQWRQLQNAAWEVNADITSIPFSVTASVIARNSAGKSKQQEPSDNPDHGSLAGNPSSGSNESKARGYSPRSRSGRKRTATS